MPVRANNGTKHKPGVLTIALHCSPFLKDSFPTKFSSIKIIPITEAA
jgi:hypothetical protein